MTGNPRCQNPDFLRQIPLQDVAFPDFRCEEGKWWGPEREGRGRRASPEEFPVGRGGPGPGVGRGAGRPSLSPAPTAAWGCFPMILRAIAWLLFIKWKE